MSSIATYMVTITARLEASTHPFPFWMIYILTSTFTNFRIMESCLQAHEIERNLKPVHLHMINAATNISLLESLNKK